MKGYKNIEDIINQAHTQTTNPIVALVAANAQSMCADNCEVTIGSGDSVFEAVSAASAKAGRMKDWVVVVSRLDSDEKHIMPAVMDQQMMRSFRRNGMNAVFYIAEDGNWEIYTPAS